MTNNGVSSLTRLTLCSVRWPCLLLVILTSITGHAATPVIPAGNLSLTRTGDTAALAMVTGMTVNKLTDENITIAFELTEVVKYRVFTLSTPDRIVVDLQSTRGRDYINRQQPGSNLIKAIRSAQHEDGTLRIVLDLNVPVEVDGNWSATAAGAVHKLIINAHAKGKTGTVRHLPVPVHTLPEDHTPAVENRRKRAVTPEIEGVPLIIGNKRYRKLPVKLAANLTGGSARRLALFDVLTPMLNKAAMTKLQAAAGNNDMITFAALTDIGLDTAYHSDTNTLHINIPVELSNKHDDLVHVTGAVLETESDNNDRLVLDLDGPVVDNIFILTEPDRIVLDLENTLGVDFINGRRLSNDLVQLVRGGAHDGNRLRVVLDLNGPAWADSSLKGPDADGQYHLVIDINHIPLTKNTQKKQQPSPAAARKKPSYDSDRIQLELKYDRAPLGSIDAIEYSGGYMLALSQLFQVLGFPVQVAAEKGQANGWFIRKNRIFVLDVNRNRVIIDGQEKPFPAGLARIRGREIYVDSSLLDRFFPILFIIDPSALSLSLKPDPKLPETERQYIVKQWLTVNGISRETGTGPQTQPHVEAPGADHRPPQTLPAVTEIRALQQEQNGHTEKPPAQPAGSVLQGLTEDNVIVLQPFIDDEAVEDFIECYQAGDRFLLPLQTLSDILHFVIEVDAGSGKAHGWFLSEDRSFELDLTAGTITTAGIKDAIPENSVYRTDTDLFIDSSLLSQWLPLNFKVDLTSLTLSIHPREPLPFQLREERMRAWKKLQFREKDSEDYDTVALPYQLASVPFIDLNLSQVHSNKGDEHNISSYSLRASGDLGYLNTNVFTYGDSIDHIIDYLRIESGRQSDSPDLLGPLRATQYSLGDITSITIPLVAQPSPGRGFTVTNKSIFRASEFDSTNFIGDATPDWDVELYRNGALIDSQVVGTDGRYEFLEVPILYGNNTFQLIFHGPEGQIREEVKRFNITDALLNKGELNYEFSMDQKSQPLFDAGAGEIINHPKTLRIGGELEYGLTKSLTGTVGMISTPLEDGLHRYLTGGLRTSWGGFLGSLDSAWDQTNSGWATRLAAYGQIWNMNIKAEHSIFNHFASEMQPDPDQLLANRSQLGINGIFSLPYVDDININLDVNREQYQSGLARTQIKNRLAKSVLGMRITNSLEHTLSGQDASSNGELAMRGFFKGFLLRANLDYELQPELTTKQFEISAQKKIFDDVTARAVVMQSLGDGMTTSLSASLNWEKEYYRFSLSADVDSEHNFSVGGNLIFSLGRLPEAGEWLIRGQDLAGRGGVIPRAYLDKNLNSQFDEGDEFLDNARFKVHKTRLSSDNGVALAMGLAPNRYTNVEIDTSGLDDPLWVPSVDGYKFIPRPGVVAHVDFPVVETSEIDGIVYLIDGEGHKKTVARIGVELVDAATGQVVKLFRSEFDGYYIMEKVRPGKYFIRISDKDLERLHLGQDKQPELTVAGESDIYNGYDIYLRKVPEL